MANANLLFEAFYVAVLLSAALVPEASLVRDYKRSTAQTVPLAESNVEYRQVSVICTALMKKVVERNVYQRSNIKTLVAVIGFAALAAFGAWQFYEFVSFKDSQGAVDLQGGTVHLWLAVGIALIVCVAGFFLFSKFLRYDTRNEIHITSPGAVLGGNGTTKNIL